MYIQNIILKILRESLNSNGINVEAEDFNDDKTFRVYEIDNENNQIYISYEKKNYGTFSKPKWHYRVKEFIKEKTNKAYYNTSIAGDNFTNKDDMINHFKEYIKEVD